MPTRPSVPAYLPITYSWVYLVTEYPYEASHYDHYGFGYMAEHRLPTETLEPPGCRTQKKGLIEKRGNRAILNNDRRQMKVSQVKPSKSKEGGSFVRAR